MTQPLKRSSVFARVGTWGKDYLIVRRNDFAHLQFRKIIEVSARTETHFDAQRGTERIDIRMAWSNRRHSGSLDATNRQYAAEWFM